jgi:hypothetical protein
MRMPVSVMTLPRLVLTLLTVFIPGKGHLESSYPGSRLRVFEDVVSFGSPSSILLVFGMRHS